MKLFVTGGNGFIGGTVVRQLIDAGHTVRCLLREHSDTTRIDGLPYERVPGDVRDLGSLRAAAANCDRAIHLAGVSSWNDINSPHMQDVVVQGTRNLLEAARESGATQTVVVSSSIAVNGSREPVVHDETSARTLDVGRPGFSYARAKAEVEEICQGAAAEGQPVVMVNPCEVYGPNDHDLITAGNLVDFAKSSPVLVCSGGTSVVHVDDVAAGVIAAMERGRPGERYILGGDNLTIRQLATLTLELLGQRKRILSLPNGLVKTVAAIGSGLRVPLPFNPQVIPYATLYWFMSNAKARHELGVSFRPAHEVLEPTLAWLKESGRIS